MDKERLKIAMLSVHSCPLQRLGGEDTGGMSVYIRELALELGRCGHEVDIYTRAHDPQDEQVYCLGPNVRLIHIEAGDVSEMNKLAIFPHAQNCARNLDQFRRQNNLEYDVIHSHYWLSGCVGTWLQDWWNIPHIPMFHTLGAIKNAVGVGETEPELRIQSESMVVGKCSGVIAATEREKADIVHYYNADLDKIKVIPCGINLDLFRPVDKEEARQRLGMNGHKVVLFVGRIQPLKGLDRLLGAMSYLSREEVVELMVVGGDTGTQDEVERLRKLSHDMQIQHIVDFVGQVDQKELPFYYSAADVCVIPSYYESFCLVALESLACGTPLVATNVGGISGVVKQGENGYIVAGNDSVDIADALGTLLTGQYEPDSVRDAVLAYDWSNIAELVVEEYREMIEHSTYAKTFS
ncbi:glycosyltransferase [Chloroflexota bacterium]